MVYFTEGKNLYILHVVIRFGHPAKRTQPLSDYTLLSVVEDEFLETRIKTFQSLSSKKQYIFSKIKTSSEKVLFRDFCQTIYVVGI